MGLTIVMHNRKEMTIEKVQLEEVAVCQNESSSGTYWRFCNHLMET